jgi:stage V sporulation protein D (sporulation-specific penicillin-binding protein)
MRAMLAAVVERGTGRNARLTGYTSGGKTGTAQIAEGKRYGGKYVASFVGLAPLSDPQLVVLVAIRDPKGKEHYGGEVAAPAFREIAEDALLLLRAPRDRHSLAPTSTPVKEGAAAFAE